MLINARNILSRRRFVFNFDLIRYLISIEFFALLTIMFISVISLYSAAGGSLKPWANKQILFFIISIFLIIFIISINFKILYKFSYLIFFSSLFLLIFVLFGGKKALGGTRWINFGLFNFQPSEFAKIGLIFFFARYIDNIKKNSKNNFFYEIFPILIALLIFFLIFIQPDLATSSVILVITFTLLFLRNLSARIIFGIIGTGGIMMPFIWKILHPYQKLRVLNFLNPERDPLGSGYNIIQSKIAIGSGGFFGTGFLKGSQSQLKFLPEHHTDFIFTTICEQFGFIGVLILMSLYFILIRYGCTVAFKATNNFRRFMSSLIVVVFSYHILVNIGMTIGLLPVAGIPLPFISYGGTTTIMFSCCFGLLVACDINNDITFSKR